MKAHFRKHKARGIAAFALFISCLSDVYSQTAMSNVLGRDKVSLNGDPIAIGWSVIVDPTSIGDWREVWREQKPQGKIDFVEYSFDGGPSLLVPGDFNSQMTELTYFEGTVWYRRRFEWTPNSAERLFIHFGAVNYKAEVYLNGTKIGSHEGGYTPFQFEVTGKVISGENSLVVRVNNQRIKDGIPGTGFDWLNYGGITRDVNLIRTPVSFIDSYFIQLKKGSLDEVLGWVKLDGSSGIERVTVKIPELGVNFATATDHTGLAPVNFKANFELWSPDSPKLYEVVIQSASDTIREWIGFRSIQVSGTEVLLNGEKLFLKGVNIHEENPFRKARAYSEEDAVLLLNWAKELGCNMVRLAHYPHNEYMVRKAEEMGLVIWSEIPIYQHIQFDNPEVEQKMSQMLREMIARDRNRCAVIIWSVSNETYPGAPNRNEALIKLTRECRLLDSTRLVTSALNSQSYVNGAFSLTDPLTDHVDLICINEYLGWYVPWQSAPEDTRWLVQKDKPVIISEFGGEALYGNNDGPKDAASGWSEEFQEKIYKDQLRMFKTIPNLAGVCPWLLVDYRSLGRMHPVYQKGWNRKGLLSPEGNRKKAWFVMREYYLRTE